MHWRTRLSTSVGQASTGAVHSAEYEYLEDAFDEEFVVDGEYEADHDPGTAVGCSGQTIHRC